MILIVLLVIFVCHTDWMPVVVGVEVRQVDVFCTPMLRLES